MPKTKGNCLNYIGLSLTFVLTISSPVNGQATSPSKKEIVEPVFRVPKINRELERQTSNANVNSQSGVANFSAESVNRSVQPTVAAPVARVADARELAPVVPDKRTVGLVPAGEKLAATTKVPHPLDRAVELAKNGLQNSRQNIADYTAILVRRERVGNVLSEPNYIKIKIRNPRTVGNRDIPFSIYMKFLKPRGCAGREVIWVDGSNSGNLIAHESAPLLKFKNFHLDPTGFLAMKGNKYPIYDAGLENLILKLVEKAERDRAAGTCQVRYLDGAKINKRPCTVIEVKHPEKRAPYEFYLAKVYIDDKYQIPVRYVSYDWPMAGEKPKLLEEYTYVNVDLNVGLTDFDFNIANPDYGFAK